MKYRITLKRSFYDYDSVRTSHYPKGPILEVLFVEFDARSSQLREDRLLFHDKAVLNKVLSLKDKCVLLCYQDRHASSEDLIFKLRDSLNFGGADSSYLYWWSIKRIE